MSEKSRDHVVISLNGNKRLSPLEKLSRDIHDIENGTHTINDWMDIDDLINAVVINEHSKTITIQWLTGTNTTVKIHHSNLITAFCRAVIKWICGNSNEYINLLKKYLF